MVALLLLGGIQERQSQASPVNEGRLRVLKVRRMTTEEYKRRVHDDITAIFALRLRYEAPLEHGVYIYAPNGAIPFGYSLERNGNMIRWVVGAGGGDDTRSPGVERLEMQLGKCWLYLPARTALEWETEIDPTREGYQDSKSMFVRETLRAAPSEIISDWFSTSEGQ